MISISNFFKWHHLDSITIIPKNWQLRLDGLFSHLLSSTTCHVHFKQSFRCRKWIPFVISFYLIFLGLPIQAIQTNETPSSFSKRDDNVNLLTPNAVKRSMGFKSTTPQISGKLMAFGDVNGDRFVDLIIWDESKKELVVHLWNQHDRFEASVEYTWPFQGTGEAVENVVLLPDPTTPSIPRLIVLYSESHWLKSPTYRLTYLTSHPANRHDDTTLTLSGSHPTFLYSTATMDPLMLVMPALTGSETTVLSPLLVNLTSNTKLPSSMVPSYCALGHPHSNAFVDVNGDCQSDLVLQCANGNYEVWDHLRSTLLFTTSFQAPFVGPLGYADLNANGIMEVVYVACANDKRSCWIEIMFSSSPASSSHDTCTPFNGGSTGGKDTEAGQKKLWNNTAQVFRLPPMSKTNSKLSLVSWFQSPSSSASSSSSNTELGYLPHLQIGDVNLDGYPDLAFVWNEEIWILINEACEPCSHPFRRQFVPLDVSEFEPFQTQVQVQQVAWFDLKENGILDLMVQYVNRTTQQTFVQFWEPKVHYDAFFFKSVVLQPECTPKTCPGLTALAFGASFKFKFYDHDGKDRVGQAHQWSQTGYHSYPLPYTLVGLGRTHQFMERMSVGVVNGPINDVSSLIPNSQILFYPKLKKEYITISNNNNNNSPSSSSFITTAKDVNLIFSWSYQLILNPSRYWYFHLIILSFSIFCLGVLAFVMQWMENRELIKEKVYLL